MLRDPLRQLAARANVPLGTIEKGFMAHRVLVVLAEFPGFDKVQTAIAAAVARAGLDAS